jgi:hypothetical protein
MAIAGTRFESGRLLLEQLERLIFSNRLQFELLIFTNLLKNNIECSIEKFIK